MKASSSHSWTTLRLIAPSRGQSLLPLLLIILWLGTLVQSFTSVSPKGLHLGLKPFCFGDSRRAAAVDTMRVSMLSSSISLTAARVTKPLSICGQNRGVFGRGGRVMLRSTGPRLEGGALGFASSCRNFLDRRMSAAILTHRSSSVLIPRSCVDVSCHPVGNYRSRASMGLFSAQPTASTHLETLSDEHHFENANFAKTSPLTDVAESLETVINRDFPWKENDIENLALHLKSRPVEGGNWDPAKPLAWAADFGRRSPEMQERIAKLVHLKPGDEGYFDVSNITVPGVTIVRTKEQAKIVRDRLMKADRSVLHACDTEVMDIDLKSVGPVGNGYVTCVSVYSGPDFDYGLGDGPGTALWIDNLDDSAGILQEFKDWFEDETALKVWHNYGFDRHVLWNEGINCRGFKGDTMHMARLQDTSRSKMHSDGNGYSLEALTNELLGKRKRPMKEIFGVKRLRKDGSEGSIVDVPPVEVMQRDPAFRSKWIMYSAYDAEGTWLIREKLQELLEEMPWVKKRNLHDYYDMHMRPFGEVLTDMERRGIRVDAEGYLAGVEKQAREDRERHLEAFRKWACSQIGPDGLALNPASSVQLCTFLFGGAVNVKSKEPTEQVRVFKVPREEIPEEALLSYKERDTEQNGSTDENSPGLQADEVDLMNVSQLKTVLKEYGLKSSGKKAELQDRLRGYLLSNHREGDSAFANDLPSSRAHDRHDAHENVAADVIQLDDVDKMTVVQLKAALKDRGEKVSGKKAELQDRLRTCLTSIPADFRRHEEHSQTTEDWDSMTDDDLREACIARSLSDKGSRKSLIERLKGDEAYILEMLAASAPKDTDGYKSISEALESLPKKEGGAIIDILNEIKEKKEAEPKFVDLTIRSIGMTPLKYTVGGAPSVTADVLKKLAGEPLGDNPRYGKAYEFFGGGERGHEACVALYSLCLIGSIDTMITNFLTSLQSLADHQSRVHCSLNLNTETGRLSSRRPNLQNQPALEKDTYKIRKAFQASPGNNLIVADYGQLELRLLASITSCESMIEAFKAGGDFHSRTALSMFDYIQKKVDDGECLLEWDYSKGDPPKPMLKDEFASERRKAKTLNFSIAYGKTAHGLSQDWGVSQKEAEEMLEAWYKARPEVRKWQEKTKKIARMYGITRTLMGRYRQLPEAMKRNRKLLGHAERASINTPIQGGAADVVMMAMNKINNSQLLKKLGWILLMQIHDEMILEGPEETAEEAFAEVVKCMENPWVFGLDKTAVPLQVDGSYVHKNWYDAK